MATLGHETVLLELNGVTRTYAGPPRLDALKGVSLTIASGEIVAIVGRSGSGKSTLLNVLGLLDRPSDGEYLVGGVRVAGCGDRELTRLRSEFFGFVFQQSFLLARHTAQENVELAVRPQRTSARERRERAAAALERVGLSHRRAALPGSMSGGECQRTAIARALAQHPQAILCDEPTGNLDERTAAEITDLLVGLAAGGAAVVMVTHDLTIAAALPRVLSLRDGRLREGLDPELLAAGHLR
ncbi:ABC transporter ATP-binding protein [Conexibacter sp. S30A1]|uniref:ABC transporter ATP-binding protein n=1 Tax=Conexibacter sp. S30A1 TaxID=2937800 RepID=UPI00200E2EA3|nr:ABC transporter ATP-binding protein [Conexibacter sp. S30A1]